MPLSHADRNSSLRRLITRVLLQFKGNSPDRDINQQTETKQSGRNLLQMPLADMIGELYVNSDCNPIAVLCI